MNDLPQQQSGDTNQTLSSPMVISGVGKEIESVSISNNELPLKPVSQEIVLPKEVVSSGVTVVPQTTQLPPVAVHAGVQPIGHSAPVVVSGANSAHLPLTDDQIARALHESIQSSIRWLAEWCVRKIKMVHARVIRRH